MFYVARKSRRPTKNTSSIRRPPLLAVPLRHFTGNSESRPVFMFHIQLLLPEALLSTKSVASSGYLLLRTMFIDTWPVVCSSQRQLGSVVPRISLIWRSCPFLSVNTGLTTAVTQGVTQRCGTDRPLNLTIVTQRLKTWLAPWPSMFRG